MKKFVIFFLILLLSILLAQASDEFIKEAISVEDSFPDIIVVYNEPVNIFDARIIKDDNFMFKVTYETNDNISFIMHSEQHLTNGDYKLEIISQDLIGNPSTVIQPFIVNAPILPITLIKPHLGVSPVQIFNATIITEKNTTCKYSTYPKEPMNEYNYNFLFDINNPKNHTIKKINTDNSIYLNDESPDEDGRETTLYLKCLDDFGLVHPTSIYLAYDTSPPSLGVSITPNPITDPESPTAILQVDSTDRTICSYTDNGEYKTFPDYNENNFTAYKKQHFLTLDFNELALRPVPQIFSEETFEYQIKCINLAGLESDVETITATISFDEEFSIEVNKPNSHTNKDPIQLEIQTSIQTPGSCKYGTSFANNNFDEVIGNRIYRTNLGALEEGEYEYFIACSAIGQKEKTLKFTVDRSKPTNVSIKLKNPVCSLKHFTAKVYAQDNYSDIKNINYSISYGSEIIAQGSTNSEINENVDFDEELNYKLSVVVYDEANNFEEAETDFVPKASNSPECDLKSPITSIETTSTSDGLLVKINCFDQESGCQEVFDYGISYNGEECSYSDIHSLDENLLVTENITLCWRVFDFNNNNATDIQNIEYISSENTYPQHCFNDILDYEESDVDCGKECPVCTADGSACLTNDDCITKSCDPLSNVCVEASCDNGFKDGLESDIDCGGQCNPCTIGQICDNSYDCETNVCEFNICTEGFITDEPITEIEDLNTGSTENTAVKSLAIPLTFIIIGTLLIIAGILFLIFKPKNKNSLFTEPRLIDQKETPTNTDIREKEEQSNIAKETNLIEGTPENRKNQKKLQRKTLIDSFRTKVEKEVLGKEVKEDEKKEEKTSQTSVVKKTPQKKKDEFINLTDLKKESDLEEENIGSNVFQELELIKKETDVDDEKKEEKEIIENKKEKGSVKKTEEKEDLSDEKPPIKIKLENEIISNEQTKKDLDSEDIFEKLAEMSGETHETVKKHVDKEEVSSKDILKVFANVTSKKQIDANVFKAILSQLLKSGKTNKQAIAEILFEFLDDELLTKKEVADLMKELKLINKK